MKDRIVIRSRKRKIELSEEWRYFCNFHDAELWISNFGRFKEIFHNGKENCSEHLRGWYNLCMRRNLNLSLEEVVAVLFIPNPFLLPYVARKDTSFPCSVDNLEWTKVKSKLRHGGKGHWKVFKPDKHSWIESARKEIDNLKKSEMLKKAVEEHLKKEFDEDGEYDN